MSFFRVKAALEAEEIPFSKSKLIGGVKVAQF